jgi:rhodanese-related sulfurtransferase
VSEPRTHGRSHRPGPTVVDMTYAGDLTPTEAWELLQRDPDAVLVDVRSEAEWMFVGVPDVTGLGKKLVTIPWNHWPGGTRNDDFLDQLATAGVPGGGPVLFICRSGARSRAAAVAATQAGIAPSYNVSEGFEGDLDEAGHRGSAGWRANGLPWRQS